MNKKTAYTDPALNVQRQIEAKLLLLTARDRRRILYSVTAWAEGLEESERDANANYANALESMQNANSSC